MYRISYRFLVPGWSAKPLVSAHDRIMGTHTLQSRTADGPKPALHESQRHSRCCGHITGETSLSHTDRIPTYKSAVHCAPAFRLCKLHLAQRWLGALYDVSPLAESKNDGLEVGIRHLDLLVEHRCILAVVLCCDLKQFPRILWLR